MAVPPTHLSASELDASSALGLLLHAAIEHLTKTGICCTRCCERCTALLFYRDTSPHIITIAVRAGHPGEPALWQFPDGELNWPYLNQFWAAEDTHAPRCALSGLAAQLVDD